MAPNPKHIQAEMGKYAEEIKNSKQGPGIKLTMTVQVFANGACRFDGAPCGDPGTDGWNSLHEHVALRLGELYRELDRLATGRKLLWLH
jgi:hypothetical protein